MGNIQQPKPVKLFIGLLLQGMSFADELVQKLESEFGPIDHRSPPIAFTFTEYYQAEMGDGLTRVFYSFRDLIDPGRLKVIKTRTNEFETFFAEKYSTSSVSRPCNLDPGYIEASKVILASTKNYSHRIYLSDGIYAEVTLQYQNKHFTSLPWTYPDFKTVEYQNFLDQARTRLINQLKQS